MKLLDSLPKEKLTKAQEELLAARGTEKAYNDLVLHTMREAFCYAKRVCRATIPDDEIFSLCYPALLRNARRFKPGWSRFFAFAKPGIRGAVKRYWKTLDTVKNGSLHENEESIHTIGITEPSIAEWDSTQDDIGESANPQESLGSTDPDYAGIDLKERWAAIEPIIGEKLTDHEQMILRLAYHSGFNFQEIGDLLGVTRSAIQSTHAKALEKIRKAVSEKNSSD